MTTLSPFLLFRSEGGRRKRKGKEEEGEGSKTEEGSEGGEEKFFLRFLRASEQAHTSAKKN